MPFIGGRYYANAMAGHALEAAREAEAALLAAKKTAKSRMTTGNSAASGNDMDAAAGDENSPAGQYAESAPIHRVEIEAAELVPSHSGRAQRGFVARVHREVTPAGTSDVGGAPDFRRTGAGQIPSRGYTTKPETHVFAGHADLLDFLKNELANSSCDK
jgi:hypothetical protein